MDPLANGSGKINILLVDDRPENLIALQAILTDPDYALVPARSGPEALGLLLKTDFALILLDVFMPGMDGYEVATTIKRRERTRHIPIIFLTAMAKEVQSIFRAYEIGAVDYIQKPFEAYVVRAKVAVFADLYRKTQEIKRQAELLRLSEVREKEHQVAEVKREGEKKFQDLVEGINHGVVWSADPENLKFTYVSPRAEPILGYPLSQWFNEPGFWAKHLYDQDREEVLRYFRQARMGQDLGFEHRLLRQDGEVLWFHTGVRLARKGLGAGYELRGLSIEITNLKKIEAELRGAVRLRDEFLSIASHELKTPLTPIKLQVQSLRRSIEKENGQQVPKERLEKSLTVIDRQLNRLGALIEDLLDVARISVGRLHLSVEEVELGALAKEVAERHTPEAERAGCRIQVQAEVPIKGMWDRLRIEQVLVNLLTNAMRYASGAPIEIRVEEADGEARFSVRDHGAGIPKEDQVRIFERFERATASPNTAGGLGLGLYIARQIVLAHGGRIRVESEPKLGACFTVDLPLAPPASLEAPRAA